MLIKNDAQRMAICDKELLRLRNDGHILGNPDRSNAFNLYSEISSFYQGRGAGCMLGHIMKARPWNLEEIEAYRKKPNALIFENCNWQEVTLRALAYVDKHLTPVMERYGTVDACDCWAPLMNGFNEFLLELLAKMMYMQCDAIYYHCEERCCFCVDTSRALKPLRFVRR